MHLTGRVQISDDVVNVLLHTNSFEKEMYSSLSSPTGLVLWQINHYWLFNAKYCLCLYMKQMQFWGMRSFAFIAIASRSTLAWSGST